MTANQKDKIVLLLRWSIPVIGALLAIIWAGLNNRVDSCEVKLENHCIDAKGIERDMVEVKTDVKWIKKEQSELGDKMDAVLEKLD